MYAVHRVPCVRVSSVEFTLCTVCSVCEEGGADKFGLQPVSSEMTRDLIEPPLS